MSTKAGQLQLALLVCAFALGLAAKPMLVTLPFLLLLLDYWPLNRLQSGTFAALRRLAVEKLPLFALAGASAAITVVAQHRGGSIASLEHHSFVARLLTALAAYGGYLERTFVPINLAVFYPYPDGWPLLRGALVGAALLLAVSGLVLRWRRTRPAALVGWCWFLGLLVPVLGLVQVGDQALADRYTYLPQIGLFVGLLYPLPWERWSRPARLASGALAAAAVATLAAVSRADVRFWRSDETLFSRAVAVTERNWMANFNLAIALSAAGKKDEARCRLQEAIVLGPAQAKPRLILGLFLEREGKREAAAASFEEALRLDPRLMAARMALAGVLAGKRRPEEALRVLEDGLKLHPDSPELLGRTANILSDQGRSAEALSRYRQALAAAPERADLLYDLAVELLRLDRLAEAEAPLREVVRLSPGFAAAWNNLGIISARKGTYREAAEQFSLAIAIDPGNQDARANLQKAQALGKR